MQTGLHHPQSRSRLEHTRDHAGDQAASTDSTTDGFLSLLGLDAHVASVHPLSCPTPGQTHGMKQRTETSPSRHKDFVHPSPHPTFQQRGCGANSTRLMLLHTVTSSRVGTGTVPMGPVRANSSLSPSNRTHRPPHILSARHPIRIISHTHDNTHLGSLLHLTEEKK